MAENKKRFLVAVLVLVAAVALVAVIAFVEKAGEQAPEQTTQETTGATQDLPENAAQPEQTEPEQTRETVPPAVWNTIPDIGGTYEQWLSAAMFMAVTLEYPEFELVGIYAASETEVADMAVSQGAYILLRADGQELLLHSVPLNGERTEAGTTDLYTAQLGFATFDVVENSVDLSQLQELSLEDLGEMITYSVLVSLYSR